MSLKKVSLTLVLLAIVSAAIGCGQAKWEYKVLGSLTDEQLNNLGKEGWELVIVTHPAEYRTNSYFKRPLR